MEKFFRFMYVCVFFNQIFVESKKTVVYILEINVTQLTVDIVIYMYIKRKRQQEEDEKENNKRKPKGK